MNQVVIAEFRLVHAPWIRSQQMECSGSVAPCPGSWIYSPNWTIFGGVALGAPLSGWANAKT